MKYKVEIMGPGGGVWATYHITGYMETHRHNYFFYNRENEERVPMYYFPINYTIVTVVDDKEIKN